MTLPAFHPSVRQGTALCRVFWMHEPSPWLNVGAPRPHTSCVPSSPVTTDKHIEVIGGAYSR